MKFTKQRVPLGDAPRVALGLPALAWTDRMGTVYYVRPGRRRFALEVAHNVRGQGNRDLHHPWWHFCVLVAHALRLHDGCATPREIEAAERLLVALDGEAIDA